MDASQENRSIWQRTEPPLLPSLSTHETADVCVVGGGISGLTVAYQALLEGRNVVLIERNSFCSGESSHTSAHLTAALDDRYFELRTLHGADGARLAAESHAFAIDEIERITLQESIDCDFLRVPGYLFLAPGEDPELLARELAACHEAGLSGVESLSAARSPLFPTGPCLRFPRQARFHAGRYLAGLARAVLRRGGRLYSHTEALHVEGSAPVRVSTNRGFQVTCENVVLATNSPLGGVALHAKMAPYRSYVVGLRLPSERADLSLFWDTADPYHYVRTVTDAGGEPLLLVGGGDHRTGTSPEENPFGGLERWARDRLGVTGKTRYRWSGQVLEPHDGLAYIGRRSGDEDHVFVVTGHSGNGLTYGTLAGRLLADLMASRENPWARLYDPTRLNILHFDSFRAFVTENARSAAHYADWLTGGDVGSFAEIPPGEGAVLREGARKLAVYRDERGRPHFFSATCPHLSGIVHWNATEKTWDCPCHGSRFDRLGHVLNGPAETGLQAIEDTIEPAGDAVSA